MHRAFHEREMESSIAVFPRVLSKIQVLIFVGDQDLICNYIGMENMIKGLTWNGQTGLGVRCPCPILFSYPNSIIRLCKHNRGM